MIKMLLYMLLFIMLFSCGKESVAPAQYVEWVRQKDNGLSVNRTIGEYNFELQYVPAEYKALLELKDSSYTSEMLEGFITDLNHLQHYVLKIGSADGQQEMLRTRLTSKEEYYARIEHATHKMQNDLMLVEGKDTLKCTLFHFERTYGIAPVNTFLLAFENSHTISDKQLIYYDRMLGTGPVYFTIDKNAIENIPELITEAHDTKNT